MNRRINIEYIHGWNLYIQGVIFGLCSTEDAQNGWIECQEMTEKYGPQEYKEF